MTFNDFLIRNSSIWMLFLIFFSGCHTQNQKVRRFSEYIADSVYLPITDAQKQVMRIKEVEGLHAETIQYLKEDNFFLYTFDLSENKIIDSFSFEPYREGFVDFFPKTKDSTYIALYNNKIILLVRGKSVHEWNAQNEIDKGIDPMAFIANLSLNTLQVFGDTIFCVTSSRESGEAGKPNIPFLTANYDLALSLTSDTPALIYKHNPNPEYFKIQGYYSLPERAYINNHTVVYSYTHSDTLYIYDFLLNKLKATKIQTEYFYPNAPFDYKRKMDFRYLMQYSLEQPRMTFGGLFYDKAHRHIFQLMKHKGEYITKEGIKNSWEDLPSSLFVFDEHLNQIEEILIPSHSISSTFFAFVTSKGLYFAAHPSTQKQNDKMLFYKIVVP